MRTTATRRRSAAAVAAVAALTTSGCGTSQDAAARETAHDLLASAAAGDGARAGALLAPAARDELETQSGKACDEAVLEEDLGEARGAESVEVFETMAQAHIGPEVVFLSRYDGRWLVVGAACTPVPGEPYDCSIGLP